MMKMTNPMLSMGIAAVRRKAGHCRPMSVAEQYLSCMVSASARGFCSVDQVFEKKAIVLAIQLGARSGLPGLNRHRMGETHRKSPFAFRMVGQKFVHLFI
jgi:hypothetical protein